VAKYLCRLATTLPPSSSSTKMSFHWRSVSLLTIYSCLAAGLGEVSTIDWTAYERGSLGVYPQVQFRTAKITAPLVHINTWNSSCASGYTFISPHGDHVLDNRLYMLDEQGRLIWQHEERGSIQNVQVQQYRGSDFITYWVGDDSFHGHGAGYYKMVSFWWQYFLLKAQSRLTTTSDRPDIQHRTRPKSSQRTCRRLP